MRSLVLNRDGFSLLREAIRPLEKGQRDFCERLYRIMHYMDCDPDIVWGAMELRIADVFIINHYVSGADGDVALDILEQTRAAMYEQEQGEESKKLAGGTVTEFIEELTVGDPPDEELTVH